MQNRQLFQKKNFPLKFCIVYRMMMISNNNTLFSGKYYSRLMFHVMGIHGSDGD